MERSPNWDFGVHEFPDCDYSWLFYVYGIGIVLRSRYVVDSFDCEEDILYLNTSFYLADIFSLEVVYSQDTVRNA